MTIEKPLVLVAGAAGVGKTSLVRAFSGSTASSVSLNATLNWHIETKYYRTDVDVGECDDATIEASTSGRPEALVLAFSLKDPKSVSAAQTMACRFDLEAVEVKLLIGTHADALAPTAGSAAELETAEQPTWFQEAADWSIKHGFELIICCPTAPTVDAALALDGDRQGVARVVEALQAHMWPNLELLARGKEAAAEAAAAADASAGGPAVAAADEAADEDDTGAAAGSGYTALDGEEAAAGPASSRGRGAPSEAQAVPIAQTAAAAAAQAGPDAGSGTAKAAENGAAGKPAAAGVGAQPKGSAATKAGAAPGEEDMDDEEAEKVMEGLEKLMEEMRGHKDRLGVMSDEERRERAAELAMRMMAMMGGLEDESGEGEEDSEGE